MSSSSQLSSTEFEGSPVHFSPAATCPLSEGFQVKYKPTQSAANKRTAPDPSAEACSWIVKWRSRQLLTVSSHAWVQVLPCQHLQAARRRCIWRATRPYLILLFLKIMLVVDGAHPPWQYTQLLTAGKHTRGGKLKPKYSCIFSFLLRHITLSAQGVSVPVLFKIVVNI